MTQEEKAKAYDDAIKKAESLYKASEPMSGCNVILETLFPELKESEDERIRGAIIDHLKDNNLTEWAAWLEKQGEPKTKENKGNIGGISSNWSEKDNWYVEDIISLLDFGGSIHTKEQIQDWLRSLQDRVQPQNRWKPSDEQMMALLYHCSNGSVLTSLYNDLNKLKEE